MTCELCNKTAIRIGTKNRGYCKEHDFHAFAQMEKDAKKKDIQNIHRGNELRMEAHRLHVMGTL